jgi:fumarate reductase subunit C
MSPVSYLLQRGTAMIMAPLVVIHLAVIVMAVQGGLSGEEILARTRGNAMWAAFYATFVVAASIHAGIGLQAILQEWAGFARRGVAIAGHVFMLVLLGLGLRAVLGVYGI